MIRKPVLWATWSLTLACIFVAPFIKPNWILSLIVILFSLTLFLIPDTKYASISIIIIATLYGIGYFPLFIFSLTLAIIVLGEGAYRAVGTNQYAYPAYILAATAGSILVMVYLRELVPLIALLGIIVAVMFKSALMNRIDVLMVEGLGVAMTMNFFNTLNYRPDWTFVLVAAIIALTFGYLAYRLHVANLSGLFSAVLIGIILIVFTNGVEWFLIMLTFFVLGSASTKYRYEFKLSLGSAQEHGGVRGYFNVFANGLVASAASILFGITHHPMFIALFLGSVATAAADTIAGEIGLLSQTPYLITTWEPVPPGTNGGVSLIGEIAGLGASATILVVAFALNVCSLSMMEIGIVAGFLGTNVDSVIGATIENSGYIGNAGTNLLATLFGGLFASMFFVLPV